MWYTRSQEAINSSVDCLLEEGRTTAKPASHAYAVYRDELICISSRIDDLQRRLDTLLALFAPETLSRSLGEQIANKLYKRAKAIAEGGGGA